MTSIFAVPLSGLALQSKRIATSASNIANISSTGVRNDQPSANPEGFVPHQVQATADPQGGVRGTLRATTPPSVLRYDPGAPDADAEGLVARPNVSLVEETVNQMDAKRAYQANLSVIKTMDEMIGSLLDLKS